MATRASFQSFLEWGLKDYNASQMGVLSEMEYALCTDEEYEK